MTQPEARLSRQIIDAWHKKGAYCWKVWGNELTPAGLPDIVGVYKGQFIGCETKMPGNDLSEIQRYRIARLRMAGAFIVAPCYSVEEALGMLNELDRMSSGDINTAIYVRRMYGVGADER